MPGYVLASLRRGARHPSLQRLAVSELRDRAALPPIRIRLRYAARTRVSCALLLELHM